MEEDQTLQKQITMIKATFIFEDGTKFHASPTLLKELNERIRKENNKISLPKEMPDCNVSLQWIEE